MNFEALLGLTESLAWFDVVTLVQLTDERRATLINQLHRLARVGKIIRLRRGAYAIARPYRQPPQATELANALLRPSYLSDRWALSFYGLIPEAAHVLTSVTTRSPERFNNAIGEFAYRHVQRALFFGFESVALAGRRIMIATPEKALLDYWYLEPGEWTDERMDEMRFAQTNLVDLATLRSMARRVDKPRLTRAVDAWERNTRQAAEEEIRL